MRSALFRVVKATANGVAVCLALPPAVTCWIEETLTPNGEGLFNFWTHVLALLPGQPGMFLRRGFYRLTLASCGARLSVSFGAFSVHRGSRVEDEVYIGPYAVIGRARLRTGCLIGTRASLLSGSTQHEWDEHGRLTPTGGALQEIEIGEQTWIGEAATVMADIGGGSLVSAGAVVSAPVPAGVVVAGNPARFVRRLRPEAETVVVNFKERGSEPTEHLRH